MSQQWWGLMLTRDRLGFLFLSLFLTVYCGGCLTAEESSCRQCGCFSCEEPCCHPDRTDEVPRGGVDPVNDCWLEGYLQSLVDMHYYEYRVRVRVQDGHAYLSHLPANRLMAESILCYIADHPCVECTHEDLECENTSCDVCSGSMCYPCGVWLPQNTVLFDPLIADPRQVTYSVAIRSDDDSLGSEVIAVSMGDVFPFYRWRNVWPWCGDAQLDLEAGVFAVFEIAKSYPLLNSDWYLAPSLSYACDRWSFRLKFSHISSHLGDEFLVQNPSVVRVNPSREALEFHASYQLTCAWR